MESSVLARFTKYREFWSLVGAAPPILVGLTLSGVKGWKVLGGLNASSDLDATLDRDVVSTPEVVLSDFAIPADVVLRPLFDFVWNGGGWSGSPNYRDGRWVQRP